MAPSSLSYAPPVRRGERPPELDFGLFETALALAEEGKPLASVTAVFQHLFPGRTIPDMAARPFSFTQGSSRVTVRIDNGDLEVSVPLIKLPTGGSTVAALRYVLTRLSGAGQLYQPRLRGDVVVLECRDKLTRMHPSKLVEILRQTPSAADNNDDWLIGEFKATPLARAPIEPVNDAEFARATAIWQEHWHDIEALLKESHKKRSMFFLNEVTAYALSRVRFALPLCGFLGARLAESAATFVNAEVDPLKRETTLGKCVKEMKAVSPDELRQNLGHVGHAFSPLNEGRPALLSAYFEAGEDTYIDVIHELRRTGKNFDAALGLIGTYYYLLANHYWPEVVEAELKQGLEQASGKPWREVVSLLFDHARTLADRFGGRDEEEADDEETDEDADGLEDDEEDDFEEEEDA